MGKKHFEALATELAATRPNIPVRGATKLQTAAIIQWDQDVAAIANVLGRFNPAFRRGTFMDWCNSR